MEQEAILFFTKNTSYRNNEIISIEKLTNSFTNINFKFTTCDKKRFHVRIRCDPNLNRQNELKIYNALRMPLIYFNIANGEMIREWIDGSICWKWNNHLIDLVVAELKIFHAIEDKSILRFNYYIFTHLLSTSALEKEIYTEYIELSTKYNDFNCVCHCDLNPNNIIYDKKNDVLKLIDFEWSRLNSHYWELANLARENMTKKQIVYLINSYGNIETKKFYDYLILTCLYAYQWTLSVPNSISIKNYRTNILKRLKFIRKLQLN